MIGAVLDRFSVEALKVPSGPLAVEVACDLPVDLLIVPYPVAGDRIDHFLNRYRRAELPERGTRVLLLAPGAAAARLERYCDEQVRVLRSDRPADELERRLEDHLRRAPRLPERKMVRLESDGAGSALKRYLQTENLSESGMFVRIRDPLPVGTRCRFELALSPDTRPIRGEAEVTRVAPREERRPGIGLRFARLDVASRRRLSEYVRLELGRSGEGPA